MVVHCAHDPNEYNQKGSLQFSDKEKLKLNSLCMHKVRQYE